MTDRSPKMLWFDNDKARTLQEKIERAMEYFKDKHGTEPNVCYLHMDAYDMYQKEQISIDNITISTSQTVLPHHMWLERAEETENDVRNRQSAESTIET